MLHNATPLRKFAVWPPNISDKDTAPARRHASLQIFLKRPTPAIVFSKLLQNLHLWLTFAWCRTLCACYEEQRFNIQKWCKHVFFDFDMCLTPQLRELNVQKCSEPVVLLACWLGHVFAPQLRTFFRQLNFQKCSDPAVCLAFWLGNALCATAACNFWSDPARWLCTRRCSEPTFSTWAKKTQCFAAFLPVRAIWSSFLASLRPSLSLFSLSLSLPLLWLFHSCCCSCP